LAARSDADAGVRWPHNEEFRVPFQYWNGLLDECRDVLRADIAPIHRRLAALLGTF
jgi:hypothetical protein